METLTADQRTQLCDEGYVVLKGFVGTRLLEALRDRVDAIYAEEGDRAGAEFKQEPGCRRLANLVNKGEIFQQALSHSLVLDGVASILGQTYKLSSLNARRAEPNGTAMQPLHCDMAAVPDKQGFWVCNTIWMLDAFTDENGPTRVIPGSHRFRKLPQDVLDDPAAIHADEVHLKGPAGSVIIMNAHCWHGGLANESPLPRTALHAFFCRGDKPQQQYQKALLDDAVQNSLSGQLRSLLALDDPHNDEVSAEVTVRSGFMK
jgi:hypothetical protein